MVVYTNPNGHLEMVTFQTKGGALRGFARESATYGRYGGVYLSRVYEGPMNNAGSE